MRPVPAAVFDLPTARLLAKKSTWPHTSPRISAAHSRIEGDHYDRIKAPTTTIRGCAKERGFFIVGKRSAWRWAFFEEVLIGCERLPHSVTSQKAPQNT
jgi:hypothetical protein